MKGEARPRAGVGLARWLGAGCADAPALGGRDQPRSAPAQRGRRGEYRPPPRFCFPARSPAVAIPAPASPVPASGVAGAGNAAVNLGAGPGRIWPLFPAACCTGSQIPSSRALRWDADGELGGGSSFSRDSGQFCVPVTSLIPNLQRGAGQFLPFFQEKRPDLVPCALLFSPSSVPCSHLLILADTS